MIAQRLKELLAILIIGDGVLALVAPRRHPRLWKFGPQGYQQLMQAFSERPIMKRFSGVGQIGLGLWLASRQWPR